MKKKVMRVGMAGKRVTFDNKYHVNWGATASSYNKNRKGFSSRKKAIEFKNKLIKKFKPKHKIDYIYLSG